MKVFPFLSSDQKARVYHVFSVSILYAVLDSAALSQAKKEEEEYQEIYHRGVLHTSFDSPLHLPSILYFSESSGFFKCSLSSCNKQERSGEVCLCVCMLSRFCHVWFFVTPWTVSHQAPLSIGFSRQEYWSGLPCPTPGDLPNRGLRSNLMWFESLKSPALTGWFFTSSATWEAPDKVCLLHLNWNYECCHQNWWYWQ